MRNKRSTFIGTLAGAILALMPFLNIYDSPIPFLSLGQSAMLLVILIGFMAKKVHIKFYFLAFTIYACLSSFMNILSPWIIAEDVIHDILAWLFFIVIVVSSIGIVNYEVFLKTLRFFGLVSLAFFLAQFVLDRIGVRIIGIIPFLPLSDGDTAEIIDKQLNSARLSGLFMEPAHYCQFMALFLLTTLFSSLKYRLKLIVAFLTSLTILLSHSTSGVILVAIAWICWFLGNSEGVKMKKSNVAMLILLFVAAFIFSSIEEMSEVTERLNMNYLTGDVGVGHYSSYIRVVRGYIPFFEVDFINQLFGSGLGSHHSYIVSHPSTAFLRLTALIPNWINSMSYLLFSTGIIGTMLFFSQLYSLYKDNTRLSKGIILCVLALFLSADCLFLIYQFLYIIIINKRIYNCEQVSNLTKRICC